MIRKKAREYAFILLFEYRFQPDAIEGILKDFIEMQEESVEIYKNYL